MVEVDAVIAEHVTIELPESVTVNGITVRGEYDCDGVNDIGCWQYEGEDWIISVDLNMKRDSAYVRATNLYGKIWGWDGFIRFNDLTDAVKEMEARLNMTYEEYKEE